MIKFIQIICIVYYNVYIFMLYTLKTKTIYHIISIRIHILYFILYYHYFIPMRLVGLAREEVKFCCMLNPGGLWFKIYIEQ